MTQAQLRASLGEQIEMWLDAYTATTAGISQVAVEEAVARWSEFDRWYDDAAVTALAADMAALSAAAQQTTAGAAMEYIAAVSALLGALAAPAPAIPFGIIRNGAPGRLVHTRPAEAYKRAVALGATHAEALVKAGLRASGVMGSDLTLQQRDSERRALERAGVTAYRRIVRPELSRTGSCGLCIAAADRVYNTGELMPIHPPSCKCTVLPIFGEVGGSGDPGMQLNIRDIGGLYDDAGSTKAADLRRTRYTVNTHGEYGQVLSRFEDAFRGPDKVRLEDDPVRASRLLEKARPVLMLMENKAWEGEDVAEALSYQRSFVARLDNIVEAA